MIRYKYDDGQVRLLIDGSDRHVYASLDVSGESHESTTIVTLDKQQVIEVRDWLTQWLTTPPPTGEEAATDE